MYERLAEICGDLRGHGDPKVLVLTGAGEKAFAAGTDISQFRAFNTPEDALAYETRIDRVITAIESCPIPTIAAISGAVTGGGASIACACDIRIATQSARFGFPGGAHARQLPVDEQLRQACDPARPGPRQGHRLHRAA
jgi:enoyl-CoA hydratase